MLVRGTVVGATALGLVIGMAPDVARADSTSTLNDQKKKIQAAQAANQNALAEDSAALVKAQAALARSQSNLATARATLASATAARQRAQVQDAVLATAVTAAQARLAVANAAVTVGQRHLAEGKQLAGAVVRQSTQQSNPLLGVAAFVTGVTTGDVNEQTQWATTMFGTTQHTIDAITSLQYRVEATQKTQQDAQTAVTTAKAAAAAQVATTKQTERAATTAASAVATQVKANQAAKNAYDDQVAADKKQQVALQSEAARVEARIKAEIARQRALAIARAKAEAARKAREAARVARLKAQAAAAARAAAAAARQHRADAAAKARAAAKAAAAARSASASSSRPSSSSSSGGGAVGGSASAYFDWPVNAPITSSYGMRFHPVLHYWKLHDGTDLGAGCGTAIRAPRDGVVSERYFNAGYGNRLMINHGMIGGHYVTTGYNHAQYYVVGVGQRVSRGQVIGYVGTTGFSTGCHLHLMVWQDGSVVNPMSRWF